jgi:hypothetical protein
MYGGFCPDCTDHEHYGTNACPACHDHEHSTAEGSESCGSVLLIGLVTVTLVARIWRKTR